MWALAAWLLWRSRVPEDLVLPHLDVRDLFTAVELDRAARYERFARIDWILATAALLVALTIYARRGPGLVRESAAGRIGTGMLLGMLGFGVVWLAQLPFGVAELWWDRRHDVTNQGYAEFLLGNWIGLGVEFLFICLAIVIVMALAGWLRDRWWLLGGPAFVALALLFAFVQPWLVPGLEPLRDPALSARARELARTEGVEGIPVRVEEVGTVTSSPNAWAAGLGPSRKVVLWDTLLDGRFPDDEVAVVLAHEFGHHARHHIWKDVAWYALFALPGAYLIALATRRRGGMFEPTAVPLSLLVLTVLQLAAQPVQNVISRHLEAEADWVALETTHDPDAARGLFTGFSSTALADPSPPTWSYVLLDGHPTLAQRLAMVEAWQDR